MKKNLFYLFALICSMSLFTACSEEEKPEVAPTVEDIIAEYSAENLKPTIEGVEVTAADVKVELATADESNKVTVILHNVVPGAPEFKIPNVEFLATTRSAYISTLKGKVTDNLVGYNVEVDGVVDEKVLTVSIVLTEIEGENIKTTDLIGLVYKGNMDINVGDATTPITVVQRVYVQKARSINMEKRDTSMVKLLIKNFEFEGMALGNITLDTVLIQKRGEVLVFKESGRKIKLSQPIGDVIANLSGTIVGEKIDLNLDIDAKGLKVGVGFNGIPVKESQSVSMEEMAIESNVIVEEEKNSSSYNFSVWDNVADKDLLLTPKYKVANNGTVDYILVHVEGKDDVRLSQDQIDGKQPIDFSVLRSDKDYIRYHMLAEDPNKSNVFNIKMKRLPITHSYDMKTWIDGNPKGLNSSNNAATFLPILIGGPLPAPGLPVTQESEGVARITTFKTESNYGSLVPAITAGTLFIGDFEIDTENTLKSTKFGVPYNGKKPTTFKFTYKYTPGETLYQHILDGDKGVAKVVEGKDECSVAAYLFEVSDYSETLDGTNINKSDKVILKAMLADGTAKTDYVNVTIPFAETGNGTFDASKKYKLAIVCTPSKWGDEFKGADLSSLYVKSLVVE